MMKIYIISFFQLCDLECNLENLKAELSSKDDYISDLEERVKNLQEKLSSFNTSYHEMSVDDQSLSLQVYFNDF